MRFAALFIVITACAQPVPGNEPSDTPPATGKSTGNQEQDWAAIQRLETEAKAIARASGCSSSDGCRTAPVGNRACGGPRYYVVYCASSTDSVALFRKLNEVVVAENAYNQRYQLASTCEFRMPPDVAITGGECRAATEQRSTP